MNLQLHLALRIAAVALTCLLVIAFYTLFHSHRLAEQNTQNTADSLAKQLEYQLLRIDSGIGLNNPFPDFSLWKETGGQPGTCIVYQAADGRPSRSLCNGAKPKVVDLPNVFDRLYRRIFGPGSPGVREIRSNGRLYGSLTVTPGAELEIAAAWNKTLDLMTLSAATIFAVCLLVYLSIRQALRPAQAIVMGLKRMESGDRCYRLPCFELTEWRRIASAINRLAASQYQLLAERQNLVVKLINLQEEERRYLARELHDEFGQCLAAINAGATSIKQAAPQQQPMLFEDADRISRITGLMMTNIRELLCRLRPAEFDELGLAAGLNGLVANWNESTGGKTVYRLSITGDSTALPESQAVSLFRIAQECLTNIAKHATASLVDISLSITEATAILCIQDNGVAATLPFANNSGIGLLGIRERINALNGYMRLTIAEPHGLIVESRLPLKTLDSPKT